MNRSSTLFFLFILPSILLGQNFEINGWQFHDYNIPKLEEAIQRAPGYNVNTLIFSHELFRSVDKYLTSVQHQNDINYLGELAKKNKIDYYLWVHELDDIPSLYRASDGRVDMDNKELFTFLVNRYFKLLKATPNTAGFVLTFHESGSKVFNDAEVKSSLPYSERIYIITKLIYDIVKENNKRLIVRNFLYEPREMIYFEKALEKLPNDIILMAKDTPHEFHPFYPPDPLHGRDPVRKQLIEVDLGVEKSFGYPGAYVQVNYIQRYVLRADEKRMTGMVGRARLFWDQPFNDSHEINLYAFHRFMNNPKISIDSVWMDWAKRHYPTNARPYIISALKRTEYINHHGRYHLGFWLTKYIGEDWHSYEYYFGHIKLRSRYKWTNDDADMQLEHRLYYPDTDIYAKLIQEKKEVIEQARLSIADIELASRYLLPREAEPIKDSFLFIARAAQMELQFTIAFFSHRRWLQDPQSRYVTEVEDALRKLEIMPLADPALYDRDKITNEFLPMSYYVKSFVEKIRNRMQDREAAIAEDNRILLKIDNELNTRK
jgi:hypothetical protein